MSRKPVLKGRAARLARLFPAGRARAARTPFVLLVVVLLGGGLIGLLVLNSALSEGSFKLDDLQKRTKSLTDEEQALQRDIDAYSSPDALQRRARELGMVPGGDPAFLGPDGRIKGVPGAAPRTAALSDPAAPGALIPAADVSAPPAPTAAPATPGQAAPTAPGPAAPAAPPGRPQGSSPTAAPPAASQPIATPTPGR
ncbi:septum formation initiator family protein [Streptomyces sp. 5-8]|uniref:Septum formation initiator family protein n=1 Tax=Streptomyces musisoli TaxID=2802280 RepID=A0ABS1P1Q3_9ACTN|nr:MULTISPECIES: septum formation initiator family protein [Streptomyces]MBL1106080.1 septum formation initiator family protein [Streptomyces musisoli]MBY8844095.1 septum formation initiator family protein [Streptomyces sp. SP2-10]